MRTVFGGAAHERGVEAAVAGCGEVVVVCGDQHALVGLQAENVSGAEI